MLTRMTEEDWATVLEVFRAGRSRRGAKGRNDRIFLEALHDFAVHNITWRALPEAFEIWMGDRWRFTSRKVLTEGQAGDSPQFEILLDLGPDITPRAAVGDKGYDGKGNRAAARDRGICPVIPFKSSAKNRPAFFPKALYRARARIEQLVGKLKRFKRIALRCEKTNRNFGSFVAFALGLIILKSVHTA